MLGGDMRIRLRRGPGRRAVSVRGRRRLCSPNADRLLLGWRRCLFRLRPGCRTMFD